ncbi:OmpA domain protein transmembrane region-containing protein [Rhodopseudomonas palustris TIE-1]|uniref:outer membrane protein n=1 Tax=Rhodopseudomonas palustris TaxID=1076 RepID=UPI000164AA4D|nr:outer membrane beta-barrel protein [Rhodopseudomonas palustris]ACF01659.1 OmpA domain protein transmembrane region-containing protein [Rhodopseudomonas palustris TIE-1]
MKKFLLGTVGLIALGTAPAMAADLAARPYTKAPPIIAAAYDWSGFYVGANGGWGTSRNCWDYLGTTATPAVALGEGCHDASGGTAGGQAGYNWQISNWVFGVEAQGNWADFKGSNVSLLVVPGTTNDSKIDAFGLFTARVGYAWNNALLYVKGGAAVTSDKYTVYGNRTGAITDTASETRWGAAVGGGLEYGFSPAWTFGVEYDHLFMGSRDITFATTSIDHIKQDVDVVTARINYRWGGPIVARY